MSLQLSYIPYTFQFNFPGGTSRGVLTQKQSWFVKLWHSENPAVAGWGEVSILPQLSPETPEMIDAKLWDIIHKGHLPELPLAGYPALSFGLECALRDLQQGGHKLLYPSSFTQGESGIRINGLIWMGDAETMLQRINEKMAQGFRCLKLKIGALDFQKELDLLAYIRSAFPARELELRVDANGAFAPDEALAKLERLAAYHLHSIEQPIRQGQRKEMAALCRHTPIPIALDEELIGLEQTADKIQLLEELQPQYIILKPSLVGGLAASEEWVQLAEKRDIQWWLTSALEGNIGLNALAQWTAVHGHALPQGLGTGQVFSNNITSPLYIEGEELRFNPQTQWQDL